MTGGKGTVRGNCHVELATYRDHLAFVFAVEQIVVTLHAGECGPILRDGDVLQVVQLVCIHCARSECANLSFAHQFVKGFHGFLHGNVVVEAMNDVEIQVFGAQAFERSFYFVLDGRSRKATFVEVHLACKHDVLAGDAQFA